MKVCSNCGAQMGDNNAFCVKCGTPLVTSNDSVASSEKEAPQENKNQQGNAYQGYNSAQHNNDFQQNNNNQQNYNYQPNQNNTQYYKPNWDHTEEFDAEDVSENKVLAICAYLDVTFGIIGVIIALLGSNNSKFASFHARQALKIVIAQILFTFFWGISLLVIGGIVALISVNAWATVWLIFLFLYGAGFVVLFVARIISFFQVCNGKSLEPIIMRHFGFLR